MIDARKEAQGLREAAEKRLGIEAGYLKRKADLIEALAAERDALRAVEANLLAENDALRFHLNNVPLQLAAARREGAEAMRERAALAEMEGKHDQG